MLESLEKNIAERRQAEEAMQTLVAGTVGSIGQEFFDKIISSLCDWLGADCAIIGEIVDGTTVRALSMQRKGEIIHDYAY